MSNKWLPLNLAMIPGVPEALDAVGEVAGILKTALDVLAGLLDTLSKLLVFLSDTLQAAIAALMTVIQGLIDIIYNLLSSGVYFYLDRGPFFSGAAPDGLAGFITRWRESFNDAGDAQRPQFTGNAAISALIVVGGASSLPDFQRLLALLARLFGIPSLEWEAHYTSADLPERIEAGMSTPPDWESLSLGEVFPPLRHLGEILMRSLGLIQVGDSYSAMLAALAQIVKDKALALGALADEIQAVVDLITALIESAGLYVLSLQANDIAGLCEAALEAQKAPDWSQDAWCAGVCLLAGSADFGPVLELFGA